MVAGVSGQGLFSFTQKRLWKRRKEINGESEEKIGEALRGRKRDEVIIAFKLRGILGL